MKTNISFLTCCLLLLASFSLSAQKKGLYQHAFGVQCWTFRDHFPKAPMETLDKIKAMGFTEVEGGASGMSIEALKKACDERGLKIPSIGAGYDQLSKPMEVVKQAKIAGANFVMCAWIPHKGDDFTFEDAQKAVALFNEAGKVLKENGITFCYHNHGYEFRPNPKGEGTMMDYIIQNTNPAYVSFELDILWALHGGADPVKLMKKYGSRWQLIHAKDFKNGVKGDFTGHTPAENDVVLGTGQANWKGILKLANKIGIKHIFIEDESNQEMVNVPKSIEYLKSL
jgi:sugar phosphate isomerase/epimerase